MPFLLRAQTTYDRGDVVSTAIVLAEGLKRHPDKVEAFRWLLDLYCEEIPHTGLEEDVAAVIEACPDPEGVYQYVFKRLLRNNRERFLARLDRARRDIAARHGRPVTQWEVLVAPAAPVIEAPRAEAAQEALAYATTSASQHQARGALQPPGVARSPFTPPAPLRQPEIAEFQPADFEAPPRSRNVARSSVARTAPAQAWADEVHPALLGRAESFFEVERPPEPRRPLPSERDLGALRVAVERPAPAVERAAVNPILDMDAIRGLEGDTPRDEGEARERPQPLSAPSGSGRRESAPSGAGRRERKIAPPRVRRELNFSLPRVNPRKFLITLAIVVGVALAGMALYRLATVIERRQAVQNASESLERFSPELLGLAEVGLAEAVAADPGSVELAGRLRWTRSLRRYIAGEVEGAAAVAPVDAQIPEGSSTAWFVAAQVIDALSEGQPEVAAGLLPTLESAAGDTSSFPVPLKGWVEAEVRVARQDLKGALEIHERQALEGFVPSMVGVVDVNIRRGDVIAARKALENLERAEPDHPAVAVGDAALIQLQRLIKNPRTPVLDTPESLTTDELNAAVTDRRLTSWVALAAPDYARKHALTLDFRAHPVLKLFTARTMLREGKVADVAEGVGATSDRAEVTADLAQASDSILLGGFANAGRPDLALAHTLAPEQGGEIGAEIFVNKHPREALMRATLLADVGDYAESRAMLMRLLSNPKYAAEARINALQLHLAEGRVEDVERHIERLKGERGALVAVAALDLYRENAASAAANLGPVIPGSLPDEATSPSLRRFELRVRLLTLKALGHHEQIAALLQAVNISPALRARVLGPEKGAELLKQVIASAPTSIDDMLDLAVALLDAGDPEGARAQLQRILALVPTHAEANRVIGRTLLKAGRGKLAARHLQASARGRDDQPELSLSVAEAALQSGDKLGALASLRDHLDRFPEDAQALALLGQVYYDTQRWTVGREDFSGRLKRINKETAPKAAGEAYLQLSRLCGIDRGTENGAVWLREARRLLGERPDVLLAEADSLHARGELQRAMVLYQRVSELPGAPQRVHLALGKSALKRGQRVLAKNALERYLRDAPEGESTTWAREQVEKLEDL